MLKVCVKEPVDRDKEVENLLEMLFPAEYLGSDGPVVRVFAAMHQILDEHHSMFLNTMFDKDVNDPPFTHRPNCHADLVLYTQNLEMNQTILSRIVACPSAYKLKLLDEKACAGLKTADDMVTLSGAILHELT